MELLNFPTIVDNDKKYYGGSQEWYLDRWKSMAGCAAISASNIAAYYEIGTHCMSNTNGEKYILMKDYINLMNTMYHYMRPHLFGFTQYKKYLYRFLLYTSIHNRYFTGKFINQWDNINTPINFIYSALCNHNPIALLILTHDNNTLNNICWHWMTITGLNNNSITLSNYGNKEFYDTIAIFTPSKKNKVRMVTFDENTNLYCPNNKVIIIL